MNFCSSGKFYSIILTRFSKEIMIKFQGFKKYMLLNYLFFNMKRTNHWVKKVWFFYKQSEKHRFIYDCWMWINPGDFAQIFISFSKISFDSFVLSIKSQDSFKEFTSFYKFVKTAEINCTLHIAQSSIETLEKALEIFYRFTSLYM